MTTQRHGDRLSVLVVSQYYLPETAMIASGLAEGLEERGHAVRVLTSYPNYPQGRIFPGYRQRWRQLETINGVEVCRVPMFIDHSQNALRRMLNYLSFGISSATARRFSQGVDVTYVYATQLTAAFGPWLRRLLGGGPYVLHVQDLWPDSITGSSLIAQGWKTRVVNAIMAPWISSVYRRASAVIGIAPQMVQTLAERGVDRAKLHLVFNWARAPLPPRDRAQVAGAEECRVVFAGNVGDMQDLETVVRAAHRLQGSGLRVQIIGAGVALARVRALSDQLSTTNVEFLDRVAPERMADIYAGADFSLVTLRDLPAFKGTIPSKFQASLANGLPVITTVLGDVRRLTLEHRVGFTAEPEDVESLEQAFRVAMEQPEQDRRAMAERAYHLYQSEFSYPAATAAIEMVLAGAATGVRGEAVR